MSACLNQVNADAVARHFDGLLAEITRVLDVRETSYWLPDARSVEEELEKIRGIASRQDSAVDSAMVVLQSEQPWPPWSLAAQVAPVRTLAVELCAGYRRFAGCEDDVATGVAGTLRRLQLESRAFLEAFNGIVGDPASAAAQVTDGMVEVKWTLSGQPELGRLTALLSERAAHEEALRRADEEADYRKLKRPAILLAIMFGIGIS